MITDASALLNAGCDLAGSTWGAAEELLGWSQDDLDHVVMHQVGSLHSSRILRELSLDQHRAHLTYREFGNIGPAAIPITLSKARELGELEEGDRIALLGIGSGLNCAMMEVVW